MNFHCMSLSSLCVFTDLLNNQWLLRLVFGTGTNFSVIFGSQFFLALHFWLHACTFSPDSWFLWHGSGMLPPKLMVTWILYCFAEENHSTTTTTVSVKTLIPPPCPKGEHLWRFFFCFKFPSLLWLHWFPSKYSRVILFPDPITLPEGLVGWIPVWLDHYLCFKTGFSRTALDCAKHNQKFLKLHIFRTYFSPTFYLRHVPCLTSASTPFLHQIAMWSFDKSYTHTECGF